MPSSLSAQMRLAIFALGISAGSAALDEGKPVSSSRNSFRALGWGRRADSLNPPEQTKVAKTSGANSWTFDEACNSMQWTPMPTLDMEVKIVSKSDEHDLDSDLVVLGVFSPTSAGEGKDEGSENGNEEEPPVVLTGKAKKLDDELNGLLSRTIEENSKNFKSGSILGSATPVVRVVSANEDGEGSPRVRRFAFVGLGKRGDIEHGSNEEKRRSIGRKIGGTLASTCVSEKGIKSCSILVPMDAFSAPALTEFASSFTGGLYADNRFRTGAKIKTPAEHLEGVTVMLENEEASKDSSLEEAEAAISAGKSLAKGTSLAKDIVNSPHNVLNSVSLADTAERLAAESDGLLTCNILEKDDCESRGMGAYLGVARGSETPPKFIHLVYRPKNGIVSKKIGIIGKGLLFDTGGYNIKTASMELMKYDCGGAAAVLGAARSVLALSPEGVEAHFVVAACENMINERAVVPGDVLVASNGKTIEVMNTDAEGRLTMADALVFLDKEIGCEKIIELSTLTGACMVALGNKIAGLWTADDDLAKDLDRFAKNTGEKVWRMPLEEEYKEQLESKIADMKNLGTRYGGSITAALFLQNFVDSKKPFAHIDMAGPVWDLKRGATGYGAKLVTEWVCSQGD